MVNEIAKLEIFNLRNGVDSQVIDHDEVHQTGEHFRQLGVVFDKEFHCEEKTGFLKFKKYVLPSSIASSFIEMLLFGRSLTSSSDFLLSSDCFLKRYLLRSAMAW